MSKAHLGLYLSKLRRLKLRHFRLGLPGLFRLVGYHLRDMNPDQPASVFPRNEINWIITPPSVSILVTVHNQSEFELNRAIQSIRFQTGTDIQVLILDDGSSRKETLNYLQTLKLRDNEKLFMEGNVGVVKARNFLIDRVTTDYLVFLDPDDELSGDFILQASKLLLSSRHIEIVFPKVLIRDTRTQENLIWETGPFDANVLAKTNTLPITSIVSSKLIKMLGGFSDDFESGFEDWDLWYRAALSGAIALKLQSIGYLYSRKPDSRTSTMIDNSDLISLRGLGPDQNFPFNSKGSVDVFMFVPFMHKIGGVEKYVKTLLADFRDASVQAVLVVTEENAIGYEIGDEDLVDEGFTILRIQDFPSESLVIDALRTLAAPSAIGLNFSSPWAFFNLGYLKNLFKANVCYVFNDEISLSRALAWESDFDEIWVAYSELRMKFSIEAQEKVNVVYTAVIDQTDQRLQREKREIFNVGFLGRFSPEKNPGLFVEIAKSAKKSTSLRFKMAGDGPLKSLVERQARGTKNLQLFGPVDDPLDFLSGIDCLMITSEVEGIPLVAMEALSLGIPVVSTDVGGIREIIDTPERGYIWDGSSKTAIEAIELVKRIRSDESLFTTLDLKFQKSTNFQKIMERIRVLSSEREQ